MVPQPLYDARDADPAYHLRYSGSGWTTSGRISTSTVAGAARRAAELWETDGMRLLEATSTDDLIQLLFSTRVDVTALTIAMRAKGRLQHALRACGTPVRFSRKLSLRSVGDNTSQSVEQYIAAQAQRSSYADPQWKPFLEDLIVRDAGVDLAEPTQTGSGRYWYNLHLVLVVASRYTIADRDSLRRLRETAPRVAQKKGFRIAALSVMPDHLHVALRGAVEASPQEIALAFQNNLAYVMGQNAIWQRGYYVGTFSEYDINAIRRRVRTCCGQA